MAIPIGLWVRTTTGLLLEGYCILNKSDRRSSDRINNERSSISIVDLGRAMCDIEYTGSSKQSYYYVTLTEASSEQYSYTTKHCR